MKCIINQQLVLSQAPDGPLAAYIGPFAISRSEQGYAPFSIHRQVRLASYFSHWLKQKEVALYHISADHLLQYLRYRARRVRPCLGDSAALRSFIDFLRVEGVIAAEKISARPLTPAERCEQAYAQYLREARDCHRSSENVFF